jgi:hypothetical protein
MPRLPAGSATVLSWSTLVTGHREGLAVRRVSSSFQIGCAVSGTEARAGALCVNADPPVRSRTWECRGVSLNCGHAPLEIDPCWLVP